MTGLTHNPGCAAPDVRRARGLTRDLITCRGCGARAWTPHAPTVHPDVTPPERVKRA